MPRQVLIQSMASPHLVWSGVVTFILLKLIDLMVGLRVDRDKEREGLDLAIHGETVA